MPTSPSGNEVAERHKAASVCRTATARTLPLFRGVPEESPKDETWRFRFVSPASGMACSQRQGHAYRSTSGAASLPRKLKTVSSLVPSPEKDGRKFKGRWGCGDKLPCEWGWRGAPGAPRKMDYVFAAFFNSLCSHPEGGDWPRISPSASGPRAKRTAS